LKKTTFSAHAEEQHLSLTKSNHCCQNLPVCFKCQHISSGVVSFTSQSK